MFIPVGWSQNIFFSYRQKASKPRICDIKPYLAIWQGASNMDKWGIPEKSIKVQLGNVHLRSIGYSIQKLSPKMDFGHFPLVYIFWISKKCRQTVIFQDNSENWNFGYEWHLKLTRYVSTRKNMFPEYPDLKVFLGQSNQFTETQAQKNNIYTTRSFELHKEFLALTVSSDYSSMRYFPGELTVDSMSQQCWGQTSISWSQCVLFGLLPITCRSRDKTILRSLSEGIHWCPGVPVTKF